MTSPRHRSLSWVYTRLRSTGRGKHIGTYSYYHTSLTDRCPGVTTSLLAICDRLNTRPVRYNVVKLNNQSRVSFLDYEDFSTPFPALLSALTCDLEGMTARRTIYGSSGNPPVLHRKELLLPSDDPIVPGAVRLTAFLESRGAFTDARRIGTRLFWENRLAALGLTCTKQMP